MRHKDAENTVAPDRPEPVLPAVKVIALAETEAKDFGHECVFEAIDPIAEKKLVRKLDLVILPLMSFVYLFQYVDKNSINNAAVFGLRTDCHMNGVQFSWVVSLFYFGQLFSEYPAAYLLSRFRITTFIGATIVIWGAVEMANGAPRNFPGFASSRFFLGFAEGAISPAFVIITSLWYRREEHPIRVAAWISMNGISQIVGPLLMYAVGGAKLTIASWRVLFLVCGGITVAGGLAFMLLMPKDTTTAWFLNAQERELATRRLAIDRSTRDRSEFNRAQMWEALKSPMTWLYFGFSMCIMLTTPILKFSSQIITGFGYDKFRTMLLGTPSGAVSFVAIWISALGPRMFPNTRIYTTIFLALIPLAGSFVLLLVPVHNGNAWAIVAATWLASSVSSLLSGVAALIASNVKGNTKKSVVSVGFFISYSVGAIVSPLAWTENDAPRYTKGCILSIVSLIALILLLLVYLFLVRSINKKRDANAQQFGTQLGQGSGGQIGLTLDSDLTDEQDEGFRYTY
ncbi:GCN5-related N-acetyltransferase (GNAT) domain-containingprotein [Purpureocillium lavendulum]|uniref:GCN5-related N-acetyltransferase (GNAT) domain-containingprotein n=1 Tax=Purpureocillium lavendulum TaxID=1247861 RepID=A0AB34FGI3_9HYPO|nr:GCN5-related N-acetyltransferase (GNAT) domain-containingprotein [Purpureocillium lavendulum]